ncbi:hypothetical protein DRO53_00485 [Candidatus Bathyarchaeota archaeon]|nr:MAG: hypothetical protein DRO53_00485 [Candidatus Bathyarchaeota archaeon]
MGDFQVMPSIEFRHVSNYALRNVDFKVEDGEFMVVLGPSGAGKTTLLNVAAGLVGYEGSVLFDGEPVDMLPAHRRNVGYVPQNIALFTHLTVKENISYGLKLRRLPAGEIESRVEEAMKLLNIKHLENRYPKTLSGGEQQRVALARALVIQPKVLLLDEPLNNLDLNLRGSLRLELKHLQRKLGITTIFVTHDPVEAEELGERVAVLVKGRIVQVGDFTTLFFQPASSEVAEVLGFQNLLLCEGFKVLSRGLAEARCGGMKIVVPYGGKGVIERVAITPDKVLIEEKPPVKVNCFRGTVEEVACVQSKVKVKLKVHGHSITATLPREAFEALNLTIGKEVNVRFPIKHVKVKLREG